MALNLSKTANQVSNMGSNIGAQISGQIGRVEKSTSVLETTDGADYEKLRMSKHTRLKWNIPGFPSIPAERHRLPELPRDYCVVGVDGSHIDLNRHLPADCYLINIGGIGIRYGDDPSAWIVNEPSLYAAPSDLIIRNPTDTHQGEVVTGTLLDAKRACEEIRGLATLLESAPEDVPTLGLVDGSLVMFGLSRHPSFVIDQVLVNDYLESMEAIRKLSLERNVVLASYISLPASTEVTNGLRLPACPFRLPQGPNCDQKCGHSRLNTRPCDLIVNGVKDRDIFANLLDEGERSNLFRSSTRVVQEYYGRDNVVSFFYMKTESEIARVEVPDWVARDQRKIETVHALVVNQSEIGPGYPVALKEAHEQAVITTKDRQHFVWLVEDALSRENLPVYSSGKNLSKIHRYV